MRSLFSHYVMLKLFYNAIYLTIAHVNHEILHKQFSLMIIRDRLQNKFVYLDEFFWIKIIY